MRLPVSDELLEILDNPYARRKLMGFVMAQRQEPGASVEIDVGAKRFVVQTSDSIISDRSTEEPAL